MGWVARRMEVSALEMKIPIRRMRITFVTEEWGRGGSVWDSSSGGLRDGVGVACSGVVVACEGGEMDVVGGGVDVVVSESRGVRSSSVCVEAAILLFQNPFQAVHRFLPLFFPHKVHSPSVYKLFTILYKYKLYSHSRQYLHTFSQPVFCMYVRTYVYIYTYTHI